MRTLKIVSEELLLKKNERTKLISNESYADIVIGNHNYRIKIKALESEISALETEYVHLDNERKHGPLSKFLWSIAAPLLVSFIVTLVTLWLKD